MSTAAAPATAHEIAELVTKARGGGRFVSESCARSLYGSGKTKEQVQVALLEECVRSAEIADICEARGVPEVKAELQASGVTATAALDRIGEAVSIKSAIRLAATGIYPMTDAEMSKMSGEFIALRVTPQHAQARILELAASRQEATAIIGTVPTSRHQGGAEDAKASMRRTLKTMGLTARE